MLREYSNILQLDTATFLAYKHSPNGLARALQLFYIVTLIAGIGVLFGIPVQANRMVLYEAFNDAQTSIEDATSAVTPFLENSIPYFSIPAEASDAIGNAAIAAGEAINSVLAQFEAEAELLAPPMGAVPSRIFRQFGRWVSVPFIIMASYIGVALVSMIAAKLLGGRGTLSQHLTAVLLASAPLVLLLPSLIPNLSSVTTIATYAAIALFGRMIALIGFLWAILILIKGMALAHEFSWERATWSLVLTWLLMYLVLPLISSFVLSYLLRF